MKMNPARVIGYVRCSTDEQSLGPQAQRDAIAKWCAANGAELVTVREDLGVSGGLALDKRPGLLAALAALREHRAGVLLAAKRDRIARDVMVAAMVERLAQKVGAQVLVADGTGNGDAPEHQLMRRMIDCFAEYERGLIRARTSAAMRVKVGRGEYIGGHVAYGYRLALDGEHLEPEPGEQAVIDHAREIRRTGLSLRGVAGALERRGMLSRTGRRFGPEQVASMVRDDLPA